MPSKMKTLPDDEIPKRHRPALKNEAIYIVGRASKSVQLL